MKKSLLVTWKSPTTKNIYKIGVLQKNNKEYIFFYHKDEVEKAKKEGFQSFGEFVNLESKYINKERLFVSFKTRIPSRKRKDFSEFLRKNFGENVDLTKIDDFEILKLIRGASATDTVEVLDDTSDKGGLL